MKADNTATNRTDIRRKADGHNYAWKKTTRLKL